MAGLYWMELYADLGKNSFHDIINGTIDSLARECPFLFITTTEAIDKTLDHMKRSYKTERVSVDLETAKENTINDVKTWIDGQNDDHMPRIRLHFDGGFRFDSEQGVIDDAAKEITLNFWYSKESNILSISIHSWEDCVLLYGKEETHRYNKNRILNIVKSVFLKSHAYYGWMDGELNSYDQSYESITEGKSTIKNEFVIAGKSLIQKVDLLKLEHEGHLYEFFDNGAGLLIERHFDDEMIRIL